MEHHGIMSGNQGHRARSQREAVDLLCEVRQGQRPWNRATLHNISETGFCMDWLPALELQRGLWLRIPGLNLLQAHIRWKHGQYIGCEFTSRLYSPVFDHIVREASGALGWRQFRAI
jgi:hypothetical protein